MHELCLISTAGRVVGSKWQVFAQVFTYINAVMVNNIMLRKDLCHWTTGIQIRRNLATVEEWSQKRGLASLLNARFVEVTQVIRAMLRCSLIACFL